MTKKTKRGGSISSNNVNSLVKKICSDSYKYPTQIESNINNKFIENNYGIEYKTTGGKRKKHRGGSKVSMPSMNGIPVPYSKQLSGWFNGDKCYQSQPFSRDSPINQEFKFNTPAFSKPLNNNCKTTINQIPYSVAGGKKIKNKSKKSLKSMRKNNKKNRNSNRMLRKSLKGSGSDWLSTHNSRGSYTASNMPLSQFRKFNTTSPYISNVNLANGAAKNFKESTFVKLPAQTSGNNPPLAYNYYNGVQTNKFKGGKKSK